MKRVIASPWLRVAVSALILGWLCYRMNWAELATVTRTLRWKWWLAALSVGFCIHFFTGLRWYVLAHPLGLPDRYRRYVGLQFVGQYINLLMPTPVGGDVIRAWYLDGGRGHRAAAFVSMFVEQTSAMAVMIGIALAGSFYVSSLPEWMARVVQIVCGGFLSGMALAILVSKWLSMRLHSSRSGWRHFVYRLVRPFANAVTVYWRRPAAFLQSLLLAVLVFMLTSASWWMLGHGLGLQVSFSYFVTIIPLVTTLLLAPISVSGIGVREAILIVLLAPLGVSEPTAIALSMLAFVNSAIVSLAGGIVLSLGAYPKVKSIADLEEQTNDGARKQLRARAIE